MWKPKLKKDEEIVLAKLYLKDHGYRGHHLISDKAQEKPDTIFRVDSSDIGIEVTMIADGWVMEEYARRGGRRIFGVLNPSAPFEFCGFALSFSLKFN